MWKVCDEVSQVTSTATTSSSSTRTTSTATSTSTTMTSTSIQTSPTIHAIQNASAGHFDDLLAQLSTGTVPSARMQTPMGAHVSATSNGSKTKSMPFACIAFLLMVTVNLPTKLYQIINTIRWIPYRRPPAMLRTENKPSLVCGSNDGSFLEVQHFDALFGLPSQM